MDKGLRSLSSTKRREKRKKSVLVFLFELFSICSVDESVVNPITTIRNYNQGARQNSDVLS